MTCFVLHHSELVLSRACPASHYATDRSATYCLQFGGSKHELAQDQQVPHDQGTLIRRATRPKHPCTFHVPSLSTQRHKRAVVCVTVVFLSNSLDFIVHVCDPSRAIVRVLPKVWVFPVIPRFTGEVSRSGYYAARTRMSNIEEHPNI
jgi:hypothetical protein